MTAQENIEQTKSAYAAFAAMDVEGASANLADDIEWTVIGNSALSGTYRGKDEVIGFWMKLAEKGFTTTPQQFFGDGDTVVVLTEVAADGQTSEQADILEFRDGQLVKFRALGDTALAERIWGTK